MSDHDLLMTIGLFTAAVLVVVAGGILGFARLAKRERAKRDQDINTATELRRRNLDP